MEVVHVTKKDKLMDTFECFHIYKETKAGNQINDRLKAKQNAVFETIIQKDPYKVGGRCRVYWNNSRYCTVLLVISSGAFLFLCGYCCGASVYL